MNNDDFDANLSKYSDASFKSFYNRYQKAKEIVKTLECTNKLNGSEKSNKILNVFKNIDSTQENKLFRKSQTSDEMKICIWLSSVNNKEKIIQTFNSPIYNGINKETLNKISKLSFNNENILILPKLLLSYGIILIYEKSLKSLKLDGVVYKNKQGTPIIALSLRYKRLDTFWFTIMHELAHVYLHYDLLDEKLIDDLDDDATTLIEQEANMLAKDTLIPRNIWRSCFARTKQDLESVMELANELGISPAIIAGRIRFESKNYTVLSKLVNSVNVEEIIFE